MFLVLTVLACPITPAGETGVPPLETGVGDTGTPNLETNTDNGPCPTYSGFQTVGTTWTYTVDDGSGTYGTEVHELETFSLVESGLYEAVETVTKDLQADSITVHDEAEWTWECNASGLWLRRVQGREDDTYMGTTNSVYYERRFGAYPLLVLARDINVGSTWTSAVRVTHERAGTASKDRLTARAEVVDAPTSQVAAGTFSTLEVSLEADENTDASYAAGVGMIQEGSRQLESYSP